MKADRISHKALRCLAVLLLAAMLLPCLAGCKDGGTDGKETPPLQTEPPVLSGEPLQLLQNGESEYVIVCNNADPIAKDLSNAVWQQFYTAYGISLTVRADSSRYDSEIVVGAAAREEIPALEAMLADENDFVIANQNGRLFLYAKTFQGSRKLMIALRSQLLSGGDKESLAVSANYLLKGHEQPADALLGTQLTLASGGKTDYVIVYPSGNEDQLKIATFLQKEFKNACGVLPRITTDLSGSAAHEIIIGTGTLNRKEYTLLKENVTKDGDYAVAVIEEKLVVSAKSLNALMYAAEYLVQNVFGGTQNGVCRINEVDEYRHSLSGTPFEVPYERATQLFTSILNRYPTIYDWNYLYEISSESRKDQQLCEALIARMGDAAAFCVGKPVALRNGSICPLDVEDYTATAQLSGSDVLVPADFIDRWLGEGSATGELVSLTALASAKGMSLTLESSTGLAVLTPNGVSSFASDAYASGGYTNRQYKTRMLTFFAAAQMPNPGNNTEQSRVVIEDAVDYFPQDSVDSREHIYTNYYSPSIITVRENGSNVLYSANERCRTQHGAELSTVTVIRKSTDGGKTWADVCSVRGVSWGVLLEVNGDIWLVGTRLGNGVVIGKLQGNTLNTTALWSIESAVFEPLVSDGIVYLALDFGIASAPVTADLTNVSNWTLTQDPGDVATPAWYCQVSGKTLSGGGTADLMEGNIVKGKDGKIYVVYRIESQPNGDYAVMLQLSEDRTSLSLLPNDASLVALPTTVSRFVIKYDSQSDSYICISNLWTVDEFCRARNVLGLSVSKDLQSWRVVDTVLVDRAMMNPECSGWAHAFQYPDWDFDGDDIVLVIREATGFTNTFHDGKYFTFYRISNFRALIG